MVNSQARKKAKDFRREFGISNITLKSLITIIEKQGYTIVEFNNSFNEKEVADLVDALGLSEIIKRSKGFTFASDKYRLVFLNEALSENEKLVVLTHEEGHIYCGHISSVPIIGKDVYEEYEANEFVHFLLNQGKIAKIFNSVRRHKSAVISAVLVILLVSGLSVFFYGKAKEKKYYGEYFLTSTGNKYHKEGCIFINNKTNIHRMTVDEFESGEYEPCEKCLFLAETNSNVS